jgi:hypothetical protein
MRRVHTSHFVAVLSLFRRCYPAVFAAIIPRKTSSLQRLDTIHCKNHRNFDRSGQQEEQVLKLPMRQALPQRSRHRALRRGPVL